MLLDQVDDLARRIEAVTGLLDEAIAPASPLPAVDAATGQIVPAFASARDGRAAMSWEDVQWARMTGELGLAQPVTYQTDAEREAIATHEAGHATVAWFAAPGRRLDVLSIVKRREALGMLAHSEAEERFTRTRRECLGLRQVAMGGMAEEEAFLGEAGTGPAGDLAGAVQRQRLVDRHLLAVGPRTDRL